MKKKLRLKIREQIKELYEIADKLKGEAREECYMAIGHLNRILAKG